MPPSIESLCAQVQARRPVDARERRSIDTFVSGARVLASPFDEHADPTHVTASAIVVGRRGVVLHRHKRLGIWLQPGGHIDPGEDPLAAALREAHEETGLPVGPAGGDRLVHVDVHPGPRGHTHLDLRYLVEAESVDPAPAEGESQDVRWFTWAEAIDLADVGLEGALRAVQPGEPVLRRAVAADAAAIAHVHQRSRRFATPTLPEVHDVADVAAWVTSRIDDGSIDGGPRGTADGHPAHGDPDPARGDEVWVADLDGVVVAEMIVACAAEPTFLDHLSVDPSWMGRGLGERMLRLATERTPAGLQLWTHLVNAGACRFHERHGFGAVETTDGSTNEERMPDVCFVRDAVDASSPPAAALRQSE